MMRLPRNLAQHRRGRALDRRGRAELDARGTLAACEALWILNRAVKRSRVRGNVYALKDRMIPALMKRLPCTVQRQVRVFECWGEWEYGCGPDCSRCGGSGVWRRLYYVLFAFEIGGRTFAWHRPEHLVDFPVEIQGPTTDWVERRGVEPEARELGADLDELLAVVRIWLEREGAALDRAHYPVNHRLSVALRADLAAWWWEVSYPARAWLRGLREWWEDLRERWQGWRYGRPAVVEPVRPWDRGEEDDDDDLPF